jgi:hypothetical protein
MSGSLILLTYCGLSCPFLMVLGLGHLKRKPLKNDVGENTRSFQDANIFLHIEARWDRFHLENQDDILF